MILRPNRIYGAHMNSRLLLVGVLLVAAVGLIWVGGAFIEVNGSSAGAESSDCLTHVRGNESRIKPENSGYSCSDIKSVLSVLPSSVGLWPIHGSDSSHDLNCRIFPPRSLPLEIRCRRGVKQFEVVAISS